MPWEGTSETEVKPTHFDLSVQDLGAARRFFETAPGWRFERFPMPYECYRIQAGPVGEPGIDASMGAIADAPLAAGRPFAQLTVPVPDLDPAKSRVLEAGGRVVEPRLPIRGVGWYATCAEPGGLCFGLIQADASAS